MTPAQPAPAQPAPVREAPSGLLIATSRAVGDNALEVTWTAVNNVDGYDLYMTHCGMDNYSLVASVPANVLGYTLGGLEAQHGYKVIVKAFVGASGNYAMESPVAHCFTSGGSNKTANPGSLTLKKTSVTLRLGKTASIGAKVAKVKKKGSLLTHDGKLRYISTNPAVATVNGKGKIVANNAGTCTIYVLTSNGIWKTVEVTVDGSPTRVKINKADRVMAVGETQALGAKIVLKPAKAVTSFTWTSSNPAVATVDQNGNVTALAKGKATITVTAANGKKAKVKIKVK